MTFPSFSAGEVLRAQDMNAVGLWLVKSQTVGTGVSSVAVTGAFSADYDNYQVIWSGGTMSVSSDLRFQLGSSTANYYGFANFGNFAGTTVSGANDNNQSSFRYVGGGDSAFCNLNINVYSPFEAKRTTVASFGGLGGNNFGTYLGRHDVSTSYSSFTISHTLGTSTMTGGTIFVYGYKK